MTFQHAWAELAWREGHRPRMPGMDHRGLAGANGQRARAKAAGEAACLGCGTPIYASNSAGVCTKCRHSRACLCPRCLEKRAMMEWVAACTRTVLQDGLPRTVTQIVDEISASGRIASPKAVGHVLRRDSGMEFEVRGQLRFWRVAQ